MISHKKNQPRPLADAHANFEWPARVTNNPYNRQTEFLNHFNESYGEKPGFLFLRQKALKNQLRNYHILNKIYVK